LIGLHDTFYQAILTRHNTFGLILDIVRETMPRDNLLNSACLELFECIRRENIKTLIVHVVEKYREKLLSIVYVDTFINLVNRYEQMQGYGADAEFTLSTRGEEAQTPRVQPNGQRWPGVGEMDAAEEAYFNTSDDEEEVSNIMNSYISQYANQLQWQQTNSDAAQDAPTLPPLPATKPLVDYPDDDDDEDAMDTQSDSTQAQKQEEKPFKQEPNLTQSPDIRPTTPPSQPPPERLSEKRRREEEDEDELVKLTSGGPKRRSSTSSNSGSAGFLRRKRSMEKGNTQSSGNVSAPPKKISINIGAKSSNTTTPTSSEKEN